MSNTAPRRTLGYRSGFASSLEGNVAIGSGANNTVSIFAEDGVDINGSPLATDVVLSFNLSAAANVIDSNLFVADRAYQLVSVEEAHTVAGSDGSAVTLDIKKCTGTQAPSAGTTMLAATIDLKGAANTVQSPALSATAANTLLAAGDRLAMDITGTPTAVAGVALTIVLRPVAS